MFKEQLRPALLVFVILTILTGVIYPVCITGIAHTYFHTKAHGSLIYRDGKVTGSALIGQQFEDPRYLWGRLSATSTAPYNSGSSSGSNIGPSNGALLDNAKTRIEKLHAADPGNKMPIPVDLVTSSASGIDPHISMAGAYYQAPRIAKARGISLNIVKQIIGRNTTPRLFGLLGEPTVNVLKVNLELDSGRK